MSRQRSDVERLRADVGFVAELAGRQLAAVLAAFAAEEADLVRVVLRHSRRDFWSRFLKKNRRLSSVDFRGKMPGPGRHFPAFLFLAPFPE